MKVLVHSNVNLHSASAPGGLVNVSPDAPTVVPDDVAEHPGFDLLVKEGTLVKLAEGDEPAKAKPAQDKAEKQENKPSAR